MKKFFKIFVFCILTVTVIFSSVLVFNNFFSKELFILKDWFDTANGGRMPYSDCFSECEATSLYKLIENGAVLSDSLMLINSEHSLNESYVPVLIDLDGNQVYINECAEKSYRNLKKAVQDNCDDSLYIISSYRTALEQNEIIKSEGEYAADIYSSEHLTGLALDVYVMYHAGIGFLESSAGKFVNENCHEYGFIIRYPYYGEEITGIPYEPWHLRYVGLPHSKIIMENKLTLEEYINSFVPGSFYFYDDYFITRQPKNNICLPDGLYEIIISPDNTGFCIITGKYQ